MKKVFSIIFPFLHSFGFGDDETWLRDLDCKGENVIVENVSQVVNSVFVQTKKSFEKSSFLLVSQRGEKRFYFVRGYSCKRVNVTARFFEGGNLELVFIAPNDDEFGEFKKCAYLIETTSEIKDVSIKWGVLGKR